ncbi:MAG: glycosyltransferase family 4 protein [Planctomycetota bacterium]
MSDAPAHILYLASQLPKRSETFVYREVLGLRKLGVRVSTASLYPPEKDLGNSELDALAAETQVVYGSGLAGKLAVYRDAFRQSLIRLPRGMGEVPPSYWLKHLFQWEAGYALAFRLRDQGLPGVTHVHAHFAHTPATVALACATALGVPFSFTGHAADLFRDGHALRTKLQHAAFVSCISDWHRDWYRTSAPDLDLPDTKLPVIRCGVDVDTFTPTDKAKADNAPLRLLAVGRLVPKKGFDVLLHAVAKLHETMQRPVCSVHLIGDGPESDALNALRKQLHLQDHVTLAGAASNDEVRAAMADADAFVLPCKVDPNGGDKDGIPVVLMEAMASGLPAVSGDLPAIRELIADHETGLMCKPGDADDLCGVLRRLVEDAEGRDRLAAAGRQRVLDEFALTPNLRRLMQAFQAAAEPTTDPTDPTANLAFQP